MVVALPQALAPSFPDGFFRIAINEGERTIDARIVDGLGSAPAIAVLALRISPNSSEWRSILAARHLSLTLPAWRSLEARTDGRDTMLALFDQCLRGTA
jgi:hypothetical protein